MRTYSHLHRLRAGESDLLSGPSVATVEARMTSSRLPGKVLLPAGGRPLLAILLERLSRAKGIDEIVVATTTNASDDLIVDVARGSGAGVHRGSEHDVLARVCGALVER